MDRSLSTVAACNAAPTGDQRPRSRLSRPRVLLAAPCMLLGLIITGCAGLPRGDSMAETEAEAGANSHDRIPSAGTDAPPRSLPDNLPEPIVSPPASEVMEPPPRDSAVRMAAAEPGSPVSPRPDTPDPAAAGDGRQPFPMPSPPPSRERQNTATTRPDTLYSNMNPLPGQPAAETLARVGTSAITARDLRLQVQMKSLDGPNMSQLSREERELYAKSLLASLVDRALIIAELKRSMKTGKQWDMMMEYAQKRWDEEELIKLVRRLKFRDEHEMKVAFDKQGISLDDWRLSFQLDQVAREYLILSVRERVEQPTLHDLRAYYQAHLREYDRPARVTWREIKLEFGNAAERAAAERRAAEALAALSRGEPFAAVAQRESAGATALKGGLWSDTQLPAQTTVPAVNEALEKQPVGTTSGILAGPQSLHIVRIEERRPAGPAPFIEVQKQVHDAMARERMDREVKRFLDRCRSHTPVWSPWLDPVETAGAAAAQAGSRG